MLRLLLLAALGCAGAARGGDRDARIVPGLVVWSTGVNEKEGPSPMVETILPARHQGQEVWRVIHRDPDPLADGTLNAYDMMDVTLDGLSPLRSVMAGPELYLALTFDAAGVTIDRRAGEQRQEQRVAVRDARPEGPGTKLFLAALPLADGYRHSYQIVDRLAGEGVDPVKWVDLTAGGVQILDGPLGRCAVREVLVAARDGSFRIREWVRRDRPHYALKTEYIRGDFVYVSEVTRMILDGAPASCER